ncbi:MAG: cysteine desulfurase [Deltaproteobacteria bacterium]|nr:cysteine desulfurase [Deltaproteobacteria bacterium]
MTAEALVHSVLDSLAVRSDFPALQQTVRGGKRLVYLDNAATSQKPRAVIDAVQKFYERDNGSVHRGVYELSERATAVYEGARKKIARFLNAKDAREIVLLRGTSEAINLVAYTYGRKNVRAGDEILITEMEHHSNIVPWQMLCEATGAVLKVAPITDAGEVDLQAFEKLLSAKTKIVSAVYVSNSLGTVNPIAQMSALAHAAGAVMIVDGAQAAPHFLVDVQAIGADFFAFSPHKMYGPSGIGALYGRYELLDAMPPFLGGGHMISNVTFAKTTYAKPPAKFEAGTPNMEGAAGLAAAIDYVQALGIDAIDAHEQLLLKYATDALAKVAGLRIIGTAARKVGVVSFVLDGVHPHDVGSILDRHGVCVRAGHHCTQPVMERFKVPATTRASFGVYNTMEDVDALVEGLAAVRKVFS